jgi:hypothetical protein
MTPTPAADPLESVHQERFFQAAKLHEQKWPELRYLFAVPNGGLRFQREAQALKRQGVRAGVPDVWLPVARTAPGGGVYHGWVGELKRYAGVASDLSEDQKRWLAWLRSQGYCADWYRGWDLMWASLVTYLELPKAASPQQSLN